MLKLMDIIASLFKDADTVTIIGGSAMIYADPDGVLHTETPLWVHLSLADERTLSITCASDGESIEMSFTGDHTSVDMEQHGKVTELPLTALPGLMNVIGSNILSIAPVADTLARTAGLRFTLSPAHTVYFVNLGDDLRIIGSIEHLGWKEGWSWH